MEDREIIGLYLARDERAINETAAKYGRLTRSIVMNILGSAADGEECENDVYLAAWNAIPPARPDNLAAFIGRTARNIALGRVEYNTAQKRSGGISKTLDELAEILPGGETPESRCAAAELGGYITDYLKGITRQKRVVFVRRYWYCDGIKEIAQRYGYSESKVKSMLMRTRNGLKKYLTGKGVEL